jgi:hypothetical protein
MIQYFPIVTGSLTVLGNINVSGSITTSGSITISGSITSASFATSASNATNAISASYANNLTVAGTLTAQTIVVQTITSSVDYITGSSINGSLSTNTHLFTGSVSISGSSTALNVNSGAFFISSSGNVGIGLTNPTDLLHLYKSGTVYQTIQTVSGGAGTVYRRSNSPTPDWTIGHGAASANENFEIYTAGTGSFVWTMNGSERIRINSLGNVGIGTSSPQINLHLLTGGTAFSSTTTYSSSTSRGILLEQSNGASNNGNAIWFNNSGLYSAISSTRENSGDWGTNIIFYTHPTATSNQYDVTERMRITSDGYVTFQGNGNGFTIGQASALTRVDFNGSTFRFLGTSNSFIPIAASAFNVNSDYRLKEDLKEFNNSIEILNKIKIYDFKWKANEERNYGVIAHELQEVLPYIVYGEKDGMEPNDEIRTQGVDYSKLVPVLVKAIQELNTKFEEYKATHP